MTGNRDTAWFVGVLVLAVTASRGHQVPTIFLNQLDDFTNLHCLSSGRVHQPSREKWGSGHLEKYSTPLTPLQERLL